MNPELSFAAMVVRLAASLALGGIIGIEREIHGRNAGLRTHMLVALGSALFTVLSFEMPRALGFSNADPTRIAAQVLTGIGFLGAGTILQGRGSIHGLTTAASIWLVAAIGMAVAGGFYREAIMATVLGHVVLVIFYRVEKDMLRRKGYKRTVTVEFRGADESTWVEQMMLDADLPASRWQILRHDDGIRLRIDGRLEPKVLQGLLATVHQRGTASEVQVERG